jgi:hypothetical protein
MPEPIGGEVVSAGETTACEILLLTDSLAFHGPGMGELTTEPTAAGCPARRKLVIPPGSIATMGTHLLLIEPR